MTNLHLFEAQDNAMNYIIMENWDTDKAIVIDHDISEEEVEELVAEFNKNGTLESRVDGKWTDTEEIYDGLFSKNVIA